MSAPTPPPVEPPDYFEQPRPAGPGPAAPLPPRLGRRGRWFGTFVALVLAAALAWLAWDLTRPEPASSGGPGGGRGGPGRGGGTTVGVASAEPADIPVVLDALGTVVPQATARVQAQVSGVLQSLHYQEGQNVRAGQLLAVIDPRPYEAALQQATGQRMRTEAQLSAARVTLQRFERLLEQDSIARQEVDTQRATVRQLEATVVSDRAGEAAARLNLAHTRITSPITGRTGLRPVDVGNVVGSGDANGVAVVTQLTPIDVEFAIPQDHAAWLQHNAGAFMDVRVYDRTRTTLLDTGVFKSLDNQIDTQTGTVRAKARFNNARQQLFPSQFVNVQLQLRTIPNAVVVPLAAVRQGGSGDHVFVLQPDRTVRMRPVVRGQLLGDRVQIVSGLQLGERVVTEGADRLREGARVVLPGDAPAGPRGGAAARDGAARPDPAGGPRAGGRRGADRAPAPAGGTTAGEGAAAPASPPSAPASGAAATPPAGPPWAPASALVGAPPPAAARVLQPAQRAPAPAAGAGERAASAAAQPASGAAGPASAAAAAGPAR